MSDADASLYVYTDDDEWSDAHTSDGGDGADLALAKQPNACGSGALCLCACVWSSLCSFRRTATSDGRPEPKLVFNNERTLTQWL